jgi:hypothetical protein
MRIKNLPEDMQVLLMQMSEESGHRLLKEDLVVDEKRFLDTDLLRVDLSLYAFPEVRVEDIDDERPIEPYLETDLLDFPPVVVAHGQFMDGRHRILAARMRSERVPTPWMRTMDASRVIRPQYAREWTLGGLNKWAIKIPKETGSTRVSLENAALLLVRYGLPAELGVENVRDEFVVWAHWPPRVMTYSFQGFSWGYSGEGPRGLESLFKMVGMEPSVSFDQILKWPHPPEGRRRKAGHTVLDWMPRAWQKRFLRGRDYGQDWE